MNPVRHVNELFPAIECYYHPKIERLRLDYGLMEVVDSHNDEWERILALRHWISNSIRIEDDNPTVCEYEAFSLIDAALEGAGFHCAHFSIVQHAILNSFGYVTRRLQAGPGQIDADFENHGVNEVWVNSMCKWVLIDAKYDIHYEDNGVPLSALEVRDRVWKDRGRTIEIKVGPDRVTLPRDDKNWIRRVSYYYCCAWEIDTALFTSYPANSASMLIVFEDDIFSKNIWYRAGSPHWAYSSNHFILIKERNRIEWTPNTISCREVLKNSESYTCKLESNTPNFRSYQINIDGLGWVDCSPTNEFSKAQSKSNIQFRVENLFGVCGPIYSIDLSTKFNTSTNI